MLVSSLFVSLALSVSAAPAGNVTKFTSSIQYPTENPFVGKEYFANSYYASEIDASIARLKSEGREDLASSAAKIKEIGTALWLDKFSKVPTLTQFLNEALDKQKATGKKQVFTMVVYNLPNRDCAAAASNGELSVKEDGFNRYKSYVDAIASQVANFPDLSIVAVVEPDSLANLVTNINLPKCSEAADAYKQGVAYAISKLQFNNVAIYLDIGHAGWLGWESNRAPAARLLADVVSMSSGKIRGFVSNVANYNPVFATAYDPVTQGCPVNDEASYIQAISREFANFGLPTNFIVDTSRNGRERLRSEWGNWCNVRGAGFGVRPSTNTYVYNIDSFVWIKPGGESDGTSDQGAARYDFHCRSSDSFYPAPEAGTWNHDYFVMLLSNANPRF